MNLFARQSTLYAHYSNNRWQDVTRTLRQTALFDHMVHPTKEIYRVCVVEDPAGKYWSWWDSREQVFCFTHWRREGVTICFPYQITTHEVKGEGTLLRVNVVNLGLAWNATGMRKVILPKGYLCEKELPEPLRFYWIRLLNNQQIIAKAECSLGTIDVESQYSLRSLEVHPDHRRKGLGYYLVQTIREDCAEVSLQGVIDSSFGAVPLPFDQLSHFYQRCGASISGNCVSWPAVPKQNDNPSVLQE